MLLRQVGAVALAAAFMGCGVPRKVELEGFALWDKPVVDAPHIAIDLAWARKMGRGGAERFAKLRPEENGKGLYLADRDGWVTVYDTATGRAQWVRHFDVAMSSGPHLVNDRVLLGTGAAEVIALARDDGHLLWRSQVSSEVLAL
ncbi:MAG: PQQ-binding-like beta-propeller repeat protein, partial [Gammaproteobacteria bacterium]|nr:PQQ-binding-like beta-propeller repeat protein [Gammaproteobacteria bacterium]